MRGDSGGPNGKGRGTSGDPSERGSSDERGDSGDPKERWDSDVRGRDSKDPYVRWGGELWVLFLALDVLNKLASIIQLTSFEPRLSQTCHSL